MTVRLKEQCFEENRDGIAALIEHGFAQAERGELIDGDEVVALLRERRASAARIAEPVGRTR